MTYRGFISVHVGPGPELKKARGELIKTGASLKMVSLENLHITLKFLGEVDPNADDDIEEIIRISLLNKSTLEVKLKGMGAFPSEKRINVIWIGVDSEGILENISGSINSSMESLGFKRGKPFQGHLTLARMRNARCKSLVQDIIKKYSAAEFQENKMVMVHLMKSTLTPQGPIYEVRRTIEIGTDQIV